MDDRTTPDDDRFDQILTDDAEARCDFVAPSSGKLAAGQLQPSNPSKKILFNPGKYICTKRKSRVIYRCQSRL
jgi:hypothetical protein